MKKLFKIFNIGNSNALKNKERQLTHDQIQQLGSQNLKDIMRRVARSGERNGGLYIGGAIRHLGQDAFETSYDLQTIVSDYVPEYAKGNHLEMPKLDIARYQLAEKMLADKEFCDNFNNKNAKRFQSEINNLYKKVKAIENVIFTIKHLKHREQYKDLSSACVMKKYNETFPIREQERLT